MNRNVARSSRFGLELVIAGQIWSFRDPVQLYRSSSKGRTGLCRDNPLESILGNAEYTPPRGRFKTEIIPSMRLVVDYQVNVLKALLLLRLLQSQHVNKAEQHHVISIVTLRVRLQPLSLEYGS